jgi:hypothetical protein
MSNSWREFLQRAMLSGTLLAAVTAVPAISLAQGGYTPGQHPQGAGHPPYGQGRPAGTPPSGMPQTTTPPGVSPAAVHPEPVNMAVPGKATPAGERFYIVASIDLQKSQVLLKYPTEVTILMKVDDSTKLTDDSGKALKLTDFRAGDTVWVNSSNGKDGVTALRIRKGEMTVADLHHYYLDYAEIK